MSENEMVGLYEDGGCVAKPPQNLHGYPSMNVLASQKQTWNSASRYSR